MDLSAFAIISAGAGFGISIGVGIALGFEIVMRLSGDGRAIILTWATEGKAQHRLEE